MKDKIKQMLQFVFDPLQKILICSLCVSVWWRLGITRYHQCLNFLQQTDVSICGIFTS